MQPHTRQVDGPSSFARNTWTPLGATRVRDRALATAGWRVLSLPYYALDELRNAGERATFVAQRLAEVTVEYLREEEKSAFPFAGG